MLDNNLKLDKKIAYIKLVLTQFLWSSVFIGGQLALFSQPPLQTALAKNLISSVCLIVMLMCVAKRKTILLPNKYTFGPLFIMGFFGVFLYTIFVYMGLDKTTAVSASLLIPTIQPIITIMLASLLAKEEIVIFQIFGLILGVLGTTIILTGNWRLTTNDLIGDILIIIAAICFSIYSVFGKKVLKYHTPLEITAYSTIIGTTLLLFLVMMFNGITSLYTAPVKFWIIMFYLVVGAGIVPLIWWYDGIKKIGIGKTGILTFLMPPISLLLAIPILHQKPTMLQLIGGCIGLFGVAVASGLINHKVKI